MALYGVSFVITYVAWDTSANAGKTGDSANHTLRWVKDGVSGVPTNSPSEVDATNLPGLYKLTLTAAEAQAVFGALGGKSSTANVSIMPVMVPFEQLPNAAPGTMSGLPLLSDVDLRTDAIEVLVGTPASGTVSQDISLIGDLVSPPTRRRVVEPF